MKMQKYTQKELPPINPDITCEDSKTNNIVSFWAMYAGIEKNNLKFYADINDSFQSVVLQYETLPDIINSGELKPGDMVFFEFKAAAEFHELSKAEQKFEDSRFQRLKDYLIDPLEFFDCLPEQWSDDLPGNYINKGWVKLRESTYKSKSGTIEKGIYSINDNCYLGPRDDFFPIKIKNNGNTSHSRP